MSTKKKSVIDLLVPFTVWDLWWTNGDAKLSLPRRAAYEKRLLYVGCILCGLILGLETKEQVSQVLNSTVLT